MPQRPISADKITAIRAAIKASLSPPEICRQYQISPATYHRIKAAIRSLIDEIRLVPEDGALKIELRGELAGILALASESTKARGLSTTGLAEQIKMVAGRGFEPLTFRL
jgi:hypothetical protein